MLEDDSSFGLSDIQIQELDAFLKQGIFLIINNLDTQRAIQVLKIAIKPGYYIGKQDFKILWLIMTCNNNFSTSPFRVIRQKLGEKKCLAELANKEKRLEFFYNHKISGREKYFDAMAKYLVDRIECKIKELEMILANQTSPNLANLPRDIFDYMLKSGFYNNKDFFYLRFLNKAMYRKLGKRIGQPFLLKKLTQQNLGFPDNSSSVVSLLALSNNILAAGYRYEAKYNDGIIRLWNIETEHYQVLTIDEKNFSPRKLIVLPGNKFAAVYCCDSAGRSKEKIVKIWNWKKKECLYAFNSKEYIVESFTYLDNNKFAIANIRGSICISDVGTGKISHILESPKNIKLKPHSFVFLSDNHLAVIDDSSHKSRTTIAVWNWKTSEYIYSWQEEGNVAIFNVFPDKNRVLLVDNAKIVKIWDFKRQILTPFLQEQYALSNFKVFSNRYLIAAFSNSDYWEKKHFIRGWDLTTKECVFSLKLNQYNGFVVLPDGCIVVGGDVIYIYQLRDLYNF